MQLPPFIPGRELSRHFFMELVQPLLAAAWPALRYTAAHIGAGSDALGFDTDLSRDHDWGPTVVLFLSESASNLVEPIRELVGLQLPHSFMGYPVGFIDSPEEPGTHIPAPPGYNGPLIHHVFPTTLSRFCERELSWTPGSSLEAADWLSFPMQRLRSIAEGTIYYDTLGELAALMQQLRWYPDQIWRYLLACGWHRIGQEDHLMSRAGYAGDELGSALIGARLVRDAMTLCFLFERRYAPYPKWFGTAFRQLDCAPELTPLLHAVLAVATWPEREAAWCEVAIRLARCHNQLGLMPVQAAEVQPFFSRPFQVINSDRFVAGLLATISEPMVRQLIERPLIGSIDQWSDSTDLRSNPSWRLRVRSFYE